MDDIGSLDSFLYIRYEIDREVSLEECLQSIFLDLSLDLHTALIRFATRIFYSLLCHLELFLHLCYAFLIFELHLLSLELGSLFGSSLRFFFDFLTLFHLGSFEFERLIALHILIFLRLLEEFYFFSSRFLIALTE